MASIYWLELSVWVTRQTEKVIALLLSLISRQHGNNSRTVNNTGQGSAVTTILSKPRIIFHVCEGQFWNMMLTMFYLNVFSLPTLKDVVGHYKLWNEVMFWLNTNCVLQCFNTFHCL